MQSGRTIQDVTKILEEAFKPFVCEVTPEDYKRCFRLSILKKDRTVITKFPQSEKYPCPFVHYQKNDTELIKLVEHVRDLVEKEGSTLEPWDLPGGVKY